MQLEGLVQTLSGDTSNYVTAMNLAEQALIALMNTTGQAATKIANVANAFDSVNDAAKGNAAAMRAWSNEAMNAARRVEDAMSRVHRSMSWMPAQFTGEQRLKAVQDLAAFGASAGTGRDAFGRFTKPYRPYKEAQYRYANQAAFDAYLAREVGTPPLIPVAFGGIGSMGGSAAAKARAAGFGLGNFPGQLPMPVGGVGMTRGATEVERSMLAAALGGGRQQPTPIGPFPLNHPSFLRGSANYPQPIGPQLGPLRIINPPNPISRGMSAVGGFFSRQFQGITDVGKDLGNLPGVKQAIGLFSTLAGVVGTVSSGFVGFFKSIFNVNSLPGLILTVTGITTAFVALRMVITTVSDVIQKMVSNGMQFERMRTTFEVLSRSPAKGQGLFADLQEMSVRTPFSFKQLGDAAQTLLGMGVPVENITGGLERLGDVAAGDADRLRRLAFAIGEVSAEGRLTGQRIRQFATVGIGIEDFAETMGISGAALRGRMRGTGGGIGANVVIDTINRLTSEGGRFFEMNKRQLDTVSGQWNRLLGIIDLVTGKMGEAAMGHGGLAGGLESISNWLLTITPQLEKFAGYVGDVLGVLGRESGNLFGAMGDSGASLFQNKGVQNIFADLIPDLGTVRSGFEGVIDVVLNLIDVIGRAVTNITGFVGKILEGVPNFLHGFTNSTIGGWMGVKPMSEDDRFKMMTDLHPTVSLLTSARGMWDTFMGGTRDNMDRKRNFVGPPAPNDRGGNAPFRRFDAPNRAADIFDEQMRQAEEHHFPINKIIRERNEMMEDFWGTNKQQEDMRSGVGRFGGFLAGQNQLGPGIADLLWEGAHKLGAGRQGRQAALNTGMNIGDFLPAVGALLQAIAPQLHMPLGPLAGVGMDEIQRKSAMQFLDIKKTVGGGMMDLGEHLPAAQQFGSAEAMDTINKAQMQNTSVLEEVQATLQAANTQREQQISYMKDVADAMEKLQGQFPELGI